VGVYTNVRYVQDNNAMTGELYIDGVLEDSGALVSELDWTIPILGWTLTASGGVPKTQMDLIVLEQEPGVPTTEFWTDFVATREII
jgi:hypothetical protein